MPPRLLSVAIVAFWLATTGWLVSRELWPRFRPGEPPPVALDFVDEATRQVVPTTWGIYHNNQKVGTARTWVVYEPATDTFALHGESKRLDYEVKVRLPFVNKGNGFLVQVNHLSSVYRVGRGGELREMSADLVAALAQRERDGAGKASDLEIGTISGHVAGAVRDGQFAAQGWYLLPLSEAKREFTLPPVEVSSQATALNPLHPVNRLSSVHPGQHWRVPLVDPLADAVRRTLPGLADNGPRVLLATVLDEPKPLPVTNGAACLIIEYRDEHDVVARTWVRQSDGLVMRQEAMQGSETLVLQRE